MVIGTDVCAVALQLFSVRLLCNRKFEIVVWNVDDPDSNAYSVDGMELHGSSVDGMELHVIVAQRISSLNAVKLRLPCVHATPWPVRQA